VPSIIAGKAGHLTVEACRWYLWNVFFPLFMLILLSWSILLMGCEELDNRNCRQQRWCSCLSLLGR
jgi:hypothetical protein